MTVYDPRATPWQIDESEFYELDDRRAQLEFLVRYAILAPSGHNTQPWSFNIVGDGIEIFADFTRRLPVADRGNRELLMSIGAAITNLRVAAAHFGYETTALYHRGVDDDPAVARVALRETCSADSSLRKLFPAIVARRTNRQPFDGRPIDESVLAAVCDLIEEQPEMMRFVQPHDRARAADLVAEGDRQLMTNPAFRQEVAAWMRPNETFAGDGVCGDAFGILGPVSALGSWLVRSVDLGPAQAKHDRDLAANASGLIVITGDDDRRSLIRSGEALERLLLLLTTLGIQYSFLNQPVEVEQLRNELWSMIRSPKPPQLMVRIGYSTPVRRPMPRRPIETVLASS
ncbi:MAG TPA: nitroreductase [Thermoanaerobaculia bacterium]